LVHRHDERQRRTLPLGSKAPKDDETLTQRVDVEAPQLQVQIDLRSGGLAMPPGLSWRCRITIRNAIPGGGRPSCCWRPRNTAASRPQQSSSSWHCSSKPDTCGSDVQSQVLCTIRAPCRNVTFSFGHRLHAAQKVATAVSKSSTCRALDYTSLRVRRSGKKFVQ
jgi:hypothetical protein